MKDFEISKFFTLIHSGDNVYTDEQINQQTNKQKSKTSNT